MSQGPLSFGRMAKSASKAVLLANSQIPEEAFYQQLLELLPLSSSAVGTAAWRVNGSQFTRIAGTSTAENGSTMLPFSQEQYAKHLRDVVTKRSPQCLTRSKMASSTASPDEPLPIDVFTFPVISNGAVPILIEAYLRGDATDSESREQLATLVEETRLLSVIAPLYHSEAGTPRGSTESALLGFPSAIHKSLHLLQTCFAIANEGRRLLGWDRVSVLRRQGNTYRVLAISGQDLVNHRADLVRTMQTLATRVALTRERLNYPRIGQELSPEIEEALEAYLATSSVRKLVVIPLEESKTTSTEKIMTPNTRKRRQDPPFAAIVIEQFTDVDLTPSDLKPRLEFLIEQSRLALRNAIDHESIFMLPLMRWLGNQRTWLLGSHWRVSAAVACAIILLVGGLTLTEADLTILSEGSLLPRNRRQVFALESGVVVDLWVQHDAKVKAGGRLLTLRNHELNLALEQIRGEVRKTQARLRSLRAQRFADQGSTTSEGDQLVLGAEEESLRAAVENLNNQERIAKERLALLEVTSPLDGKVMTWKVEDLLRNRPIQRGQILMEIADVDGPWELSLRISDRYVADLLAATAAGQTVPVTFLVASDTTRQYVGQIADVSKATMLDPESGQNIRAIARISDTENVPAFQAGTTVQARIHCGRRSLGYVWFRDIWAFIYSRLLFPWS
jgi:multidrug efflux pump subunit AcrA (membrane-fusion protein)